MKLLIDTQVFIWLINNDSKIGKKTLEIVSDPLNQLNLSYFSVFEMIIKKSVGKLQYNHSLIDDLPGMGINLLLPDETTLQNYTLYNPDNKDPFDNSLIAVAIHENCLFITSDPKILSINIVNLILHDAKK